MIATEDLSAEERLRKLRETAKNFGDNSMLIMSGIGVGFRGRGFKSEQDRAAHIELRTRWIIALWLPVIPIGSYRVRDSRRLVPDGRSKRVLELFSQEPLAWAQIFRMWSLTAAGIALLLVVYYLSW